MPLALSEDLRWRIVMLHQYKQYSISEIATLLVVSQKSVQRVLARYSSSGDVEVTKRHGPEVMLGSFKEMILVQFLMDNLGAYLDELQTERHQCAGKQCSTPTLCRTFSRLGLTRKNLRRIAMKRSVEARSEFRTEMASVHADMLIWIDETGTDNRDCCCHCGYHMQGMTPTSHILDIRGKRLSVITAMSTRGIENIQVVQNTVGGDAFLHFVQTSLVRILQPFDGTNRCSFVIMDNASIHHVDRVTKAIYQTGAIVRFLPPYSPDFNHWKKCSAKSSHF